MLWITVQKMYDVQNADRIIGRARAYVQFQHYFQYGSALANLCALYRLLWLNKIQNRDNVTCRHKMEILRNIYRYIEYMPIQNFAWLNDSTPTPIILGILIRFVKYGFNLHLSLLWKLPTNTVINGWNQ